MLPTPWFCVLIQKDAMEKIYAGPFKGFCRDGQSWKFLNHVTLGEIEGQEMH